MKNIYFNKFAHALEVKTFSLDSNSFEDYNLDMLQNKEELRDDIIPVSSEEISSTFPMNEEFSSLNKDDFSFTESIPSENSKYNNTINQISPYQEINKVFSEFDKEVSNLLLQDPSINLSDNDKKEDPFSGAKISLTSYVSSPSNVEKFVVDSVTNEDSLNIQEIKLSSESTEIEKSIITDVESLLKKQSTLHILENKELEEPVLQETVAKNEIQSDIITQEESSNTYSFSNFENEEEVITTMETLSEDDSITLSYNPIIDEAIVSLSEESVDDEDKVASSENNTENINIIAQESFTEQLDEEIFEMTKEFENIDLDTLNHIIPADSNELDELDEEESDRVDELVEIFQTDTPPVIEIQEGGFSSDDSNESYETSFNEIEKPVVFYNNEALVSSETKAENIDIVAQDAFTSQLDAEILEMVKEFELIDLETVDQIVPSNSNELDEFSTEDSEDLLDTEISHITKETQEAIIDNCSLESSKEMIDKDRPEDFVYEKTSVLNEKIQDIVEEKNSEDKVCTPSPDQDSVQKIENLNNEFTALQHSSSSNIIDPSVLDTLNSALPSNSSHNLSLSHEELRSMMKEIDDLLDLLPDEKIEELSQKNFYHLYIKFLDELGI
ncbi:MAG: hypothetical protein ACRCTJ_07285 [Brevinema sp.]